MKPPYNLDLMLFGCAGITSFDDVLNAVRLLREQDLVLVELKDGVNQPASDARAFLSERSFDFVSRGVLTPAQLASPAQHLQIWGGPCARADALASAATFGADRRRDDAWDLTVHVATDLLNLDAESLDAAVTAWLTLLERAGRALYDQIQPGLGVILAARPSDTSELTPPYLKRRLFVGWRTWYGPGYVETFGRDLLLGLPDRAEKLDDGGVYQALDATPLDLVTGKPSVYAGVAAYLAERDIQPAWLRLPRPKSGNASRPKSRSGARPSSVPPTQPETPGPDTVDEDTGPDEFQQDVRELLSTVIVLTTGLRVLMLPLAWSELGESERMIAFRHLLYAVQSQLTQHPDCRVRVEFQEIPAELRAWLEASYPAGGPVSYGLLTDTPPD